MCWICIGCLAGVERKRVGGVVGGRGWGSPHWLMTESDRAPHSPFPPPTSPLERGEIYPEHQLQNPKPHPVVLPMLDPNPPSSKIQITQLSFCFRSFFFLFTGPRDGKLAPVSHSCSWVLMPLKVWHRAVIWDRSPGSGCGCSPAGFPMGNGNHCSIYCLVSAAFPHTKQIPHNRKQVWRKKKRETST